MKTNRIIFLFIYIGIAIIGKSQSRDHKFESLIYFISQGES